MNFQRLIGCGAFKASILVACLAILMANAGNASVCWQYTYSRGVGTIPQNCSPQQTKSGLLCYPACKPGYTNEAGICWQDCPDGFRDDGALCRRAEYSRGTGYALWDEEQCKKDNPEYGCEKSGLLYYPKCKPGYEAVGCCICRPTDTCPAGWKEVAGSCQKDSYVVEPITPTCDANKEYDAGLCYDPCKSRYSSVGPICWGQCPADRPVKCGALCATTIEDCTSSISEMVLSVAELAAKVASIAATAGAGSGATAAASAVEGSAVSALKDMAKDVAIEVATQTAKIGAGAIVNELEKKGLPSAVAGSLSAMVTNPETFDYQSFLAGLDPTGIMKVVEAYNKEICPAP